MSNIFKWIKGFIKINYEVKLANKDDRIMIVEDFMRKRGQDYVDGLNRINNKSSAIINDARFKIVKFKIKRERDNSTCKFVRREWELSGNENPLYHLTVSDNKRAYSDDRTNGVNYNIFFLGIDNRIWKMQITATCTYRCRSGAYTIDIKRRVISYINDYINIRRINMMTKSNILIDTENMNKFTASQDYQVSEVISSNSSMLLDDSLLY